MDDAEGVRRAERREDVRHRRAHHVERGEAAADDLRERLPLEVLHDEVPEPLVLAEVQDAHDVAVVEPRRRLRLALEALRVARRVRDVLVHELDRDRHVEREVLALVDLAHAADPEAVIEAVAPREREADARLPGDAGRVREEGRRVQRGVGGDGDRRVLGGELLRLHCRSPTPSWPMKIGSPSPVPT